MLKIKIQISWLTSGRGKKNEKPPHIGFSPVAKGQLVADIEVVSAMRLPRKIDVRKNRGFLGNWWCIYSYLYWLVVYLPLWKIWKSVGIMTSQYMEK